MDINIRLIDAITIVSLTGDVTTNTAPIVQSKILLLATPGCKILVDLSQVAYLSSAGLRMLLSLYRQTIAQDGQLVLVGLSEEIADTMSVTGFLNFFTTCDTLATGLSKL
jgi:anti-sigma B factor antagonist